MRKFGLIGFPLGHSFSKEYFTGKFAVEKIKGCSYDNYPISSIDEFQALLAEYPELCGLNVTIPYKTLVLGYIDAAEPAVKEIGAANVLKIKRREGKTEIKAYNSDVYGIGESLKAVPPEKIRKALVFGTGGSSRAVSWVLGKMGIELSLVSRKKGMGILSYNDLDEEIISSTGLIINTTPLGMYPDIMSKPAIDYSLLNEKHVLFDLVYNPEITAFLQMGKERGCTIITGLKMLYLQAERSWEIWNDPDL